MLIEKDASEQTRNSILTALGVLDSSVSMGDYSADGPARTDSGIFGLSTSEAEAEVVLIPVAYEATTSYGGGAAGGPRAILEASRQIDLRDGQVGCPYRAGIFMRLESPRVREMNREAKKAARSVVCALESGLEPTKRDLGCVNQKSRDLNLWLQKEVGDLLDREKLVGIVGGDHSVALGSMAAHAISYGSFGILQLDAHADLRTAYEGFSYSHASVMERALSEIPEVTALVQVAVRDVGEEEFDKIQGDGRIHTVFDHMIARARLEARLLDVFRDAMARLPDKVYLSFDIDGLDPGLCPGTGTPVPGGLSFMEAAFLVEMVVSMGKKIIGFDLCEVAPRPEDQWDGNVGARLLYKMIGFALKSRSHEEPAKSIGDR